MVWVGTTPLGLKVGDLVEVVDDDYVHQGRADPLLRVEETDPTTMRVTLSGEPTTDVGRDVRPNIRYYTAGITARAVRKTALRATASCPYGKTPGSRWRTASRSRSVPPQEEGSNFYRTGDYWLIPARTATGDVLWPGAMGQPEAQPPHGVQHHYAPLAIVAKGTAPIDCRCSFERLGVCPSDNR